jgi:hypothetical protein
MKHLLFIFLFALTGLFATAQKSGSDTLTATASIIGGDGTGRIVSYQWSGTGPGTITFDSPTSQKTIVHVNAVGNYKFSIKVVDNLGNIGTDDVDVAAYLKQGVIVTGAASSKGISLN